MDGFVIIDCKIGRQFHYDGKKLYEGSRIENQTDMEDVVNRNHNNVFILLFDSENKWERFIQDLKVPKQQIWDWKSLVWGDEKRLHIRVYSPTGQMDTYYHGRTSFGGILREKEIIIADNRIPGVECYTRKEFYNKLFEATINKFQAIQAKESVPKTRDNKMSSERNVLAIEDTLAIIIKKLDQLLSERQQLGQISTSTRPVVGNNEKIEKSLNYIISLLENSTTGNNNGKDALVSELKSQLEEYKVDFYYKTMRKYGIDAMLDVVEYLYTRMEESNETEEVIYKRIIDRIEQRTLKDKLNVRTYSSEIGVPFDASRMISYSGDSIQTDDESKHNTVARSVRPAFYWTMPMVNGQESEYLFKEEVVILYKFQ